MSCEAPRPRWRAGLFHPLSASLWIAGVLCAAVGVFLTSGIAGFLPQVGTALVLLGTSNGAVTALDLGSVFKLTSGSRHRIERITHECAVLQSRMESVAKALCTDAEAIRRTIGLTISRVAEQWTSKLGGTPFTFFLLCSTIAVARKDDAIFGSSAASDWEHERRVILALHTLCDVPAAEISKMLDCDIVVVRDVLAHSTQRGAG